MSYQLTKRERELKRRGFGKHSLEGVLEQLTDWGNGDGPLANDVRAALAKARTPNHGGAACDDMVEDSQ